MLPKEATKKNKLQRKGSCKKETRTIFAFWIVGCDGVSMKNSKSTRFAVLSYFAGGF